MAKKKNVNNGESLVVSEANQQTSLGIQLTQQDIVTWKVAKAEEFAEKRITELETQSNVISKRINDLEKDIYNIKEEYKEGILEEKSKSLPKSILNDKAIVEPTYKLSVDTCSRSIKVKNKYIDKEFMTFRLEMNYSGKNEDALGSYGTDNHIIGAMPITWPTKIGEINKQIEGEMKAKNKIDMEISKLTEKIANIDKMERRAKANVVEQIIKSSPALADLAKMPTLIEE